MYVMSVSSVRLWINVTFAVLISVADGVLTMSTHATLPIHTHTPYTVPQYSAYIEHVS